ncbi:MAG: hypothetical protein EOO63_13765 [Hymenobacter sp.]|nr:MAG: hypothetical protein EOO63_13765 [Hymenobacter sp.]
MQEPTYYEVSFATAKSFIASWSNKEIEAPTQLTDLEVAMMEVMLTEAVSNHNEQVNYSKYSALELGKYGVQYTPYLTKAGEKLIWINGFMLKKYESFTNEKDGDYSQGVVFVLDGGNNYFTTTINLTMQKIVPVRINGTA